MQTKVIPPEVLAQILSEEFQTRFWSHIAIGGIDECWLWQLSTVEFGYGQLAFRIRGKHHHFKAHKIAWISTHKQDTPDSLGVLHSCKATPACCSPWHLRIGTQLENLQEMAAQGRRTNRQGENSATVKLTNAKVFDLREKAASKQFTREELLQMFSIGKTRLWEIVTRKAWTHI